MIPIGDIWYFKLLIGDLGEDICLVVGKKATLLIHYRHIKTVVVHKVLRLKRKN